MTRRDPSARAGFSLIEVLVAMGLLVVGMSGVMALFSASLALQKEAQERLDVGQALLGIQAEIERDLAARLGAEGRKNPQKLQGQDLPVPGNSAYRYRVTVEPVPGEDVTRGFLCRIVVVARRKGNEALYDLGYIPVVPHQGNDALIRVIESGNSPR